MSDASIGGPREIVPVDHSADPDGYDRWERFSDRCNPILVRELLQALTSRGFFGMLALSTVAVCVLGFAFAWAGQDMRGEGRIAFSSVLFCIVPIAVFMVPVQSFQSMRQEVQGGLAEQISLTRLRPWSIVLGKTLAGVAQFVLFLAVFAPVMALTFLLRGVDVPTIAITLVAALLASVAANSFAVAMATVGRTRVLQSLMQALTSVVLLFATFFCMGGAAELPDMVAQLGSDPDAWMGLVSVVGAMTLAIVLFGIIATVSLAHSYENRSSPFRIYALFTGILMPIWIGLAVRTSALDEAPMYLGAIAALVLAPIWLYACAEDPVFSPRVWATVSPRPGRARLRAPLLPGGDRGLVFTTLLGIVVCLVALAVPPLFGAGSVRYDSDAVGTMFGAWGFAVFYGSLAFFLRTRLVRVNRATPLAFGLTLLLLALACILPLVLELLIAGRIEMDWHLGQVFNPFFTLAFAERHSEILVVPLVLFLVSLPLVAIAARRGWRTVSEASRARRERDAMFRDRAEAIAPPPVPSSEATVGVPNHDGSAEEPDAR